MRFNSPELLEAWQATGEWPAIHNAMSEMAITYVTGRRLLDLGCSYGLLGARITAENAMEPGIGVDASSDAIAAGKAARVPLDLKFMRVLPRRSDWLDLMAIIRDNGVDVVIARRVFPELFGEHVDEMSAFGEELRRAGIKELLVQGRVETAQATNRLHSVVQEYRELANSFRDVAVRGSVAYLVAR